MVERRGVDDHLVGAGSKAQFYIVQRAHPAAERQRHEAHLRHLAQHVEGRTALIALLDVVAPQVVDILAADVEQHQLVDIPVGEALDRAHRVADYLMHAKELAAHDDALLEEQHGNEARSGHRIN